MTTTFLVLFFFLVSGSPVLAQVYRWEDEQGVIHMTDDLQKVPEEYRERTREIILPKEKEVVSSLPKTEGSQVITPYKDADLVGHDRKWWQNRVREWKQKKTEAEQQLAEARKQLNMIPLNLSFPIRLQTKQEILQDIETYEKKVQEAEQVLSEELPEEARRAGAPPGWVRE